MRKQFLSTALILAMAGSFGAACNRAENPAEVRKDVSEARQEANQQIADARRAAAEQATEARKDVGETMNDASDKVADANKDVAMARIEGERDVSLQRCEAMSGDAQKSCKDEANATYDLAKQRVDNTFRN